MIRAWYIMDNEKISAGIVVAFITLLGTVYLANKSDPARVPQFEATLEVQKTLIAIAEVEGDTLATPSAFVPTSQPSLSTSSNLPVAINIGEDWEHGCISVEIWQIYSSGDDYNAPVQEGCYQLIADGTSAHQGYLAFVRTKVREPEVYGLITEIPTNVKISFTLQLNHLENAEVWVGVVKVPTSWDGIYLVSKDGGNFAIREVTNNIPAHRSRKYHDAEEPYRPEFQFEIEGNQWDISYDNSPAKMFADIDLDFSPRYLFIGYRAYPEDGMSGSLDTRISDLIIEER